MTATATESSFEMDLPTDMGSEAGPSVLSLHREPPEAADAAELLEGGDEGESGDVAETDEEIIDLDFATPQAAAAAESTSEVQPAAEHKAEPAEIIATATKAVESHVAAEKRRKAYLREKDVLQEHISALMIEQMKLREQAKQCKKEAEVHIEKLNSLIDDWENPGDDSPMDADVDADADAGDSGQDGKALADGCVADHDDRDATERPRTEPVSQQGEVASQARYQAVLDAAAVTELDLPAKLLERIQEAGATTVWRLEKLRGEIALGREKWPKGIGEAKVTAIEDALMKWMSAHQESWDAPEAGPLDAEIAAGGAVDPECEAAVEAAAVTSAPSATPAPTIDDL